jgi:hypothetical protein
MRHFASFVIVIVAAIGAVQPSCTDAPPSAGPDAAAGAGTTGGGRGGTTGGATGGSAGGGGPAGNGGGAAPARVFEVSSTGAPMPLPSPCDATGACPEEQTCFHLAAELAVCDIRQSPVRTTCGSTVDECDCSGRTCAGGLVCVTLQESAHFYNTCLQTACTAPADCAGGTVCTPTSLIVRSPGRCFPPACRSDADCSGGAEGRCALVVQFNGGPRVERVGCVFAGEPANATACSPAEATPVRLRDSTARYYTCAGR